MSNKRNSPFLNHCGIELVSMGDGQAVLAMELTDALKNSGGMIHGGAIATIADSAAGPACWSLVGDDKMAVPTDFNLSCLKSLFAGMITAEATILHAGRRFMRAEVSVKSGDDLLARAGVSFMMIDRPVDKNNQATRVAS